MKIKLDPHPIGKLPHVTKKIGQELENLGFQFYPKLANEYKEKTSFIGNLHEKEVEKLLNKHGFIKTAIQPPDHSVFKNSENRLAITWKQKDKTVVLLPYYFRPLTPL